MIIDRRQCASVAGRNTLTIAVRLTLFVTNWNGQQVGIACSFSCLESTSSIDLGIWQSHPPMIESGGVSNPLNWPKQLVLSGSDAVHVFCTPANVLSYRLYSIHRCHCRLANFLLALTSTSELLPRHRLTIRKGLGLSCLAFWRPPVDRSW